MHLYEYRTKDGELSEIVADQHVDAWEFYLAVRKSFGIEVNPGSISHMWEQRFKWSDRKRGLNKLWGSIPVTVGVYKGDV